MEYMEFAMDRQIEGAQSLCAQLEGEADELRRQRNVLYNVLSVVLELLDEHMQYTNAKVSTYQRLQDARRILAQYDKEMANDE